MNATATNPATQKQLDFINRLVEEKDLTLEWEPHMGPNSPESLSTQARTVHQIFMDNLDNATTQSASLVIDYLKAAPRKPSTPTVEVPEGMHQTDMGIFKVQRAVHGSGNLYAKQLVQRDEGWKFEYRPGAIRSLSDQTVMDLEVAKAFGALYGTCAVCARTLTNEDSIAAGIGPVCAQRF